MKAKEIEGEVVQRDEEAALRELNTPLAVIEGSPVLAMIERAARDPAVDTEKMERLFALYERRETAEHEQKAKQAFNEAMRLTQEEIEPIRKDADNPQTRSKYASYAALDRAIRAIYTKNGLSVSFDQGENQKPEVVRVLCFIEHRDGFTRTHHIDMPIVTAGIKGAAMMTLTHATGSAFSYGRRYLLGMIFNLATTDDDGNAAGSRVECISPEQLGALNKLLTETVTDFGKFCEAFKIEALPDLPAKRFDEAIGLLNKKKAMAKAKAK